MSEEIFYCHSRPTSLCCELKKEIFSLRRCHSYFQSSSDLLLIPAAGDLVTFSRLKAHYTTCYSLDTELFTRDSRPAQVQALYEAARDKAEPQVSSEETQKKAQFEFQYIFLRFQQFSSLNDGYGYDVLLE